VPEVDAPRGQVLNLRTGAIRMRLKDSIQSLRSGVSCTHPLTHLPTVERDKILPKMAHLTLRANAKPHVTDLFSVQLDGT
jgi:hypothetical protein